MPLDVFGVAKLYPTKLETIEWTSAHWHKGSSRFITKKTTDDADPTGWAEIMRGGDTGAPWRDGNGVLTVSGREAIYSVGDVSNVQFWKNVEVTVYYQRVKDDDTADGGLDIGVRS